MINKTHFSNIISKNILRDSLTKNLSQDFSHFYVEKSIDNMVLNSNLDNENIIK